MTVQTELRRVVQTGNGATSTFYFNAPVLGLDDLDVYTVTAAGVQTLQTRGGAGTFDYTITINASTKYATVTLNNNLTNGFKVVMLRSTAITQGVDYVEGDPFLAETHEGALDRLTIIATQLQEQLDRSVKVVETSTTTGIKIEELEADKILVVNSAADGLTMGPTLAEVDTVADNIADVQTVATNIASVNTVASDLNEAVSEINTVAVNITNVNNVGTYITNVNTVATDIANVNTVASDLNEAVSEIHTVGTNIASVNTVGTDIANVNTVAGAIANVNTAATNIANINTNATNIASINTNASNIVAIQNASTNATNASNSASAAATSETNSAASAALANDWATKTSGAVAGGEFSAKYHAQAAATSASGASTSASNASTSATNASNSATASAASAVSAASSAASAAALLDNFDDRYLGAKASDPALDNDGNALVVGALYFNTTDGVMKVYTASGWIAASSASVATLATFEFVATSGQTVFTGADANGATLSYVAPALIVTLNGVRLRPGDDYTATNGTSITLVSAAALNDELVVDAFGSFLVANTVDLSTAQTIGGVKTFNDKAVFNNDVGIGLSTLSTNNGNVSRILGLAGDNNVVFAGTNANANYNLILEARRAGRGGSTRYAQIQLMNTSDDGDIVFYTAPSGSDVAERGRFKANGDFQLSTANTKILNNAGRPILQQSGSVLQVVQAVKTDAQSTSSTTPVDITGLSVSITPSSTSSKILVMARINLLSMSDGNLMMIRLLRGSTPIVSNGSGGLTDTNDAFVSGGGGGTSADNRKISSGSLDFLDSPATSSSITYKMQMVVNSGTGTVNRWQLNDDLAAVSSITLMEISA